MNDAPAIRLEAKAKERWILERGRARRLDLLERLPAAATDEESEPVRVAAKALERAFRA